MVAEHTFAARRDNAPLSALAFLTGVSLAAQCEAIVTHNVRDFSGASAFMPRSLLPSEFLALLEE